MKSDGALTMLKVLHYGFSALYVRVDAKTRASWSGVPIGYCRTALRRLVARGYVERAKHTKEPQIIVYGLTEAGLDAKVMCGNMIPNHTNQG